MRVLLVGVRGHGGEEVYSTLLRDRAPAGAEVSATFDYHRSCSLGRCRPLQEILLNRLVARRLQFNMGFRVLDVSPEVDLVHVHTHPTILRRRGRRPVVFSAGSSHYHYVKHYEGWSEERIRETYRRARAVYRRLGVLDALIAHEGITLAYTFSEWARGIYLEMGVPPEKIRVLPPGFDIPPPSPRPTGQTVTFLFMGRQPSRKGGDLALAAFSRLRQRHPAARLLYASDEKPHAVPEGVEVLDLVPSERVASFYSRADVFLNPTRAEGFGFTNVEAQGFGLPVISTRIAAIPEVVEHGVTGVLVSGGDAAELEAAMARLTVDPQFRARMGVAARRTFESRFSMSLFQGRLASLYEEAQELAGATAR